MASRYTWEFVDETAPWCIIQNVCVTSEIKATSHLLLQPQLKIYDTIQNFFKYQLCHHYFKGQPFSFATFWGRCVGYFTGSEPQSAAGNYTTLWMLLLWMPPNLFFSFWSNITFKLHSFIPLVSERHLGATIYWLLCNHIGRFERQSIRL